MCLPLVSVNAVGMPPRHAETTHQMQATTKLSLAEFALYDYSQILCQQAYKYLGYIGNNYQRLYIHFSSVTKDAADATLYHVKGASRVRNNVCNFAGTIHLKGVSEDKENRFGKLKQYLLTGEYDLCEDQQQPGSGRFRGKNTFGFYLYNNQVRFDDLTYMVSDGYTNNTYEGQWTSYKTGKAKKANWGVGRIPDSERLDTGTAEFHVAKKYVHNGWETYSVAMGNGDGLPLSLEDAVNEEHREWWQGKDEVRQTCRSTVGNDRRIRVQVYRNGALAQLIELPIDSVSVNETNVGNAWFGDVTGDGRGDLLISLNGMAHEPAYYACYTWNEQQRQYVRIPSYTDMPNPTDLDVYNTIFTYIETEKGHHVQKRYAFQDGRFVQLAALYRTEAPDKPTHYTETKMVNGKEMVVKETDNEEDTDPIWGFLPF